MDTTIVEQTALAGLTLADIFIGDNGIVILISSMILALFGNLFKKYRRFITAANDEADFNVKYWVQQNSVSMIAGFFITYTFVRLLNVITPIVLNNPMVKEYIPDSSALHVSEILIVVSLAIGYYVDKIEPKLPLNKLTKKTEKDA